MPVYTYCWLYQCDLDAYIVLGGNQTIHDAYCTCLSIATEFLVYDDACHLKKYACNPVRCNKTPTAERMASLTTVVDKFHFVGHVDPWCKEHCNPYKFKSLESVSVSRILDKGIFAIIHST